MTRETQSKAILAATLIAAKKDRMANDVIGDVTNQLTPDEITSILDALSERFDGAQELNLEALAPYGLPYVLDILEVDELTREGAVALLDRALECFRVDPASLESCNEEYASEAVMRPYSMNEDDWRVVDLRMELDEHTSVTAVDSGVVIYDARFGIHFEDSNGMWETYISCRLDVVIKHNGRVRRLGKMHRITSNWYEDSPS